MILAATVVYEAKPPRGSNAYFEAGHDAVPLDRLSFAEGMRPGG